MKKFGWVLLALFSGFVVFVVARMASTPTDISPNLTLTLPKFASLTDSLDKDAADKYAVAVDGQVVFANSDQTQPTASTAKMILSLMVMEKKPFKLGEKGETITITQQYYDLYRWYIAHNGSNSAVRVGEEISEYDAIASAMLPSSNNMADTLAIWAFGSLENYKASATEKLAEWGLKDTTIGTDASGFSATTTSSASDLALIGQRLINNPVLADIVSKKSLDVPVAGTLKNTNKLLGSYGVVGIKTGYIGDVSGYNLVTAYKMDKHLVTLAVLNAKDRAASFSISEEIIKKLQDSLKLVELAKNGDEVGYIDSWWTGRVPIKINSDVKVLGWSEATQTMEMTFSDGSGTLKANIGPNSYTYDVSADYQKEPTFWQKFLHAIFLM